jgi:hypothetical protein
VATKADAARSNKVVMCRRFIFMMVLLERMTPDSTTPWYRLEAKLSAAERHALRLILDCFPVQATLSRG